MNSRHQYWRWNKELLQHVETGKVYVCLKLQYVQLGKTLASVQKRYVHCGRNN